MQQPVVEGKGMVQGGSPAADPMGSSIENDDGSDPSVRLRITGHALSPRVCEFRFFLCAGENFLDRPGPVDLLC